MAIPEMDVIANRLHEIGAVKFGQFEMKANGPISPFYIDLRETASHMDLFIPLAQLVASHPVFESKTDNNRPVAVCGIPMAAIPLATFAACNRKLPLLLYRKEQKDHGTKKIYEGTFQPGTEVILVDDVADSGESVLETAQHLRRLGFIVEHAVIILDRESGAKELLATDGVQLHSVMGIRNLCNTLQRMGKLTADEVSWVHRYIASKHENLLKNGTSH